MMKFTFLLFIILLSGCFQNQKPELIIPDARRDEIFTEFVNPITEKFDIPKLRESGLSANNFEVRVWFSAFEIDGFILRRIKDDWSAIALKEIDCKKFDYFPKDKMYELGKINLPPPESGWENAWHKLVEAGIINLPYSFYIPTIDESGYALETNINGTCRIHFYGSREESTEAQQMRKIGEIVAEEFGLINFKVGSLCLER